VAARAHALPAAAPRGTAVTPEGEQTYTGPTEFALGFPQVVEMKEAGDFEAVSDWVVGLRGPACHRVEVRESPTRLLIDRPAPAGLTIPTAISSRRPRD
jgi:hypothetical protein